MDNKYRYVDFEIEAVSLEDAADKIDEIQEMFGEDASIQVRFVSVNKDKAFSLLNEGIQKITAELQKKIGGNDK